MTISHPTWGRIQFHAIEYFLKQEKRYPFDMLVLMAMISIARYQGIVYKSQREIAEYMKSDVSSLNKSIKRLIALGMLHKIKGGYRIDPATCRIGS